jgi:hypothetical protein
MDLHSPVQYIRVFVRLKSNFDLRDQLDVTVRVPVIVSTPNLKWLKSFRTYLTTTLLFVWFSVYSKVNSRAENGNAAEKLSQNEQKRGKMSVHVSIDQAQNMSIQPYGLLTLGYKVVTNE